MTRGKKAAIALFVIVGGIWLIGYTHPTDKRAVAKSEPPVAKYTRKDLGEISTVWTDNAPRFKRDIKDQWYSDVMKFRTAENKMFGASYHVVFADAYCDVPPAQKDLRDRLADFKYGQFLKVSGKISSVTNEGLHLWDCSMEVAELPAGYKDAEDLVNELFKKPSGQ